MGSIPGLGRSPGEGNGNTLQHSCLGNPMDRGAWQATVHGVSKSQAGLNDFHFHFFLSQRPMESMQLSHNTVIIVSKGRRVYISNSLHTAVEPWPSWNCTTMFFKKEKLKSHEKQQARHVVHVCIHTHTHTHTDDMFYMGNSG